MSETEIQVISPSKQYMITIGEGLLTNKAILADKIGSRARRIAIISDTQVAKLFLAPLQETLSSLGHTVTSHLIQPGEASKSYANFEKLTEALINDKISRKDSILALGGGVVGDLAGFLAATLRRGTGFIQVPTTLLSQVDSSVGGKTAINSPQGKNLIGAFYQPDTVIIDTSCLKTLPVRELRAGFAEVIKYGMIKDEAFFDFLNQNASRLYADNSDNSAFLQKIIAKSCQMKADIVALDEREQGMRALLNFGHTFGHAIEALAGYDGTVLHGEAVALGMVMALKASIALGMAPASHLVRLITLYQNIGIKPFLKDFNIQYSPEGLMEAMAQDKKIVDDQLVFILGGIGQSRICTDVSLSIIKDVMSECLELCSHSNSANLHK